MNECPDYYRVEMAGRTGILEEPTPVIIECWSLSDALDLSPDLAAVLKYLFRAGRKIDPSLGRMPKAAKQEVSRKQDLMKALDYLSHELERMK